MGEVSGAVEVTTSSMVMKIKAVTEALKYLQLNLRRTSWVENDPECRKSGTKF